MLPLELVDVSVGSAVLSGDPPGVGSTATVAELVADAAVSGLVVVGSLVVCAVGVVLSDRRTVWGFWLEITPAIAAPAKKVAPMVMIEVFTVNLGNFIDDSLVLVIIPQRNILYKYSQP